MLNKIKQAIVIIFVLFILLGAVVAFHAYRYLQRPLAFAQVIPETRAYVMYTVEAGSYLRQTLADLEAKQILPSSIELIIYARLFANQPINKGTYRFYRGITPIQLLKQLIQGKTIQYRITLREGWTFRQVMHALFMNPVLKHELQSLSQGAIMLRLGYPGYYPEGLFFPDTYFTNEDMSDIDVLQFAYQLMEKRFMHEWEKRDANLPYTSPYEALIVASLIEKETARAEERPMIADIILRRLSKGMRLQIDPTIAYGMGENYRGKLTHQDVRTLTNYNTYLIKGLPPTPICMPGLSAIRAALHPQANRYWYFVAKGDGSHVFSESLTKHNSAVGQYRKFKQHESTTPANFASTLSHP